MKIIFGQDDYVERIKHYLQEPCVVFSFPINSCDPANITFDFSFYDDRLRNLESDSTITVAFTYKYQKTAIEYLHKMGFTNLCLYDADMDNVLKRYYLKKRFAGT